MYFSPSPAHTSHTPLRPAVVKKDFKSSISFQKVAEVEAGIQHYQAVG